MTHSSYTHVHTQMDIHKHRHEHRHTQTQNYISSPALWPDILLFCPTQILTLKAWIHNWPWSCSKSSTLRLSVVVLIDSKNFPMHFEMHELSTDFLWKRMDREQTWQNQGWFVLGTEEDGIQAGCPALSGTLEDWFKESSRTVPAIVKSVNGRAESSQGYFVYRSWHMEWLPGQWGHAALGLCFACHYFKV